MIGAQHPLPHWISEIYGFQGVIVGPNSDADLLWTHFPLSTLREYMEINLEEGVKYPRSAKKIAFGGGAKFEP